LTTDACGTAIKKQSTFKLASKTLERMDRLKRI
jgi:hypothetical protein